MKPFKSSKMAGSRWDKVLEFLTETFKKPLTTVKSHDLIDFCLENNETRKAIEDYLEYCTAQKRSSLKHPNNISLQKKDEGNKQYKNKNYEESLLLYTESILWAAKNDECLPLAYSNRSLILQQLGYISESIQDIDLALETGYPIDKAGKLILRKARCLVQLGQIDKAKEVLVKAIKSHPTGFWIVDSHQDIKKELERIKTLTNKSISKTESKLPELAGGENKDFVSVSKYLSVFYSHNKGRHVRANQDIEFGDVLFVEKPYTMVVFQFWYCDNCCNKTVAPIPCENCMDVSFCSPECRDVFWKSTHIFECGFGEIFKSVGIAHLSLRIILKASSSVVEFKKKLNTLKEPEYKEEMVVYRSADYDSVYNLVNNSEKYESSDLFQYVMTAILLAMYLKNYTNYFSNSSEDDNDLKLLSSVIWRHIMQLICNGHAIVDTFLQEQKGSSVSEETEKRIATGIYPSASMMNHSCEPSVIYSFCKNRLIVRAAKSIKKGDEVFNCYGPHARRMKRNLRQEILKKQYFFNCECSPCLQKYDIQEKFTAYKCAKCKGPSVPEGENFKEMICLNCGQVSKWTNELLDLELSFKENLDDGLDFLRRDNANGALISFVESWRCARKIFYKFHTDLSYVADEVARCLALLKDFRRCALFLKCCVLSVEERFGSSSIEFARELNKLADAITNYSVENGGHEAREMAKEGVICYQRAQKIFSFYHTRREDLETMAKNKGILETLLKKS